MYSFLSKLLGQLGSNEAFLFVCVAEETGETLLLHESLLKKRIGCFQHCVKRKQAIYT